MSIYIGSNRYKAMVGSSRADFVTKKALPYDAEIEYLYSNGTQRMNLQYYPNPNTTLIVDMQFVSIGNDDKSGMNNGIFGTNDSGSGTFSANFGNSGYQGGQIYVWNDKKYGQGGSIKIIQPQYSDSFLKRYTMTLNSNSFTYWNRTMPLNTKTTTNTTSLWFWGNENSSLNRYGLLVFSIKISEDNVLIRDMIPVRVGQTGYLYDKISGQLFGNNGTGSFTLGPDKT